MGGSVCWILNLNRMRPALRSGCCSEKSLVQVDADFPIKNADYKGYEDWAHGSAALTARGQEAVDALDYGGKEHAK